jgi:hypothetical protein
MWRHFLLRWRFADLVGGFFECGQKREEDRVSIIVWILLVGGCVDNAATSCSSSLQGGFPPVESPIDLQREKRFEGALFTSFTDVNIRNISHHISFLFLSFFPIPYIRSEPSTFAVIARSIYRNPIPFLLFMPVFCIFLIGFGFSGAEIEDSVSELWARKDSQYYHDLQYREKVRKNDKSSGGGNSGALVIAIPRKGSNVMSSDYLAEIEARMNETENIKVKCFFIQLHLFSNYV